jgi:hypothetical protein
MKSFRQEMEAQASFEDFDPEDILNAFKQLGQPPAQPAPAPLPPTSPPHLIPPEQLPKKTVLIKKGSVRLEQSRPLKHLN